MQRLAGVFCTFACALVAQQAVAANYFVDAVAGSDTSTGTAPVPGAAGTGPWRTLGKVNGAVLQPGDAVYFRCGQSWRGTLRIASSADPAQPVRYSRYGSDCTEANKPTFTAADTIRNWQPYAGNIWVATPYFPVYQLHVDGVAMRLAQHPNPETPVEPWSTGMFVIDQSFAPPNTNRGFYDADLASVADRDLVGAGIHVRINDYTIDDRIVSAFDPGTNGITVNQATNGSLRAKWGYYLDNKLWMLDQPGEFFFDGSDPAQMKVYLWMPDGGDPGLRAVGSTNAYAIDATSATNAVIETLRTDKAGAGVAMSLSTNVVARSVDIFDSYYRGILANNSVNSTIDNCTIRRTIREGIQAGTATGLKILNSRVTESGMVGSPVTTRGAISTTGTDVQIKNNYVANSAYHGITFGKRNDVANNRIENVCLQLADCGAIYTGNSGAGNDASPHNSVVYGNIITGVRGNRNGRDPYYTQVIAPGVYLDYKTTAVYVGNNTIRDTDMGVFIHAASGNTITDNTIYDYDTFAVRIKEYLFSRVVTPNRIQRNRIIGLRNEPPIMLVPAETTVSHLATYDYNRYSGLYAPSPEVLPIAKITTYINGRFADQFLDIQQWRQAGNDTSSTVFDAVRINPFAYRPVTGLNLLSNGTFDAGITGWISYASAGDAVASWSTDCLAPGCARLATGTTSASGSLISPAFPVEAGKTYVVSFADRGSSPAMNMTVVPRMAGPRTYDLFQDRYPVTVIDAWRSHNVLFTVPAGFVIQPTDRGGRIDFAVPPGQALSLDNVRVEEATYTANVPEDDTLLLVNTTGLTGSFSCPEALTDPQKCTEYLYFDDELPVSWPVAVAARSTRVLVWAANPFRAGP